MKVWIAIGIVIATVAGLGLMEWVGGVPPFSRAMGPGWECGVGGPGRVCVKDIKNPPRTK